EESLGKDASKQGRINAIDADEDITLVNDQDDQDDADMFDVNTLTGDEVFVEQEVAAKDVILTVDKVTLAQALAALKSVKPKVKANVVIGQVYQLVLPVQRLLLLQLQQLLQFQLQGKELSLLSWVHLQQQQQFLHNHHKQKFRTKAGILVKEPVKPKKKDLIRLDEEISLKLQAEFDEEERLAREKDEANVALTEEWDDIQAKQRRKHFAAKRAEEKRNKPPTQAQQRKIMCTYMKSTEGKKPKDLKNKSFDSIQKMFDRAFKRVNTFVDFRIDLVEGSSKRLGDELKQEVTKKQKVDDVQETTEVDDDQETTKIKELMKVVSDEEEVAIDAIPLATKPPTIADWKIHKEGKKTITR
ncbi:hypothetical protein Tco_0819971, partial [Tanacetum coccineum]